MATTLKDLTGKNFERLTVIKRHGTSLPIRWECNCECGNTTDVRSDHLRNGDIVSCGCYAKEIRRRPATHGQSCRAGGNRTKAYITWEGIKQRCHNPNANGYERYGGRGITVCNRWRNSFEAFFEDMGTKPKGLTLERVDNDEGYSKENCEWATMQRQACNRRNTRMISYNGKEQTMTEWAREYGLDRGVLWHRLYNMKWDMKDAFERPVMKKPRKK